MTRALRDGIKAGQIKGDEIAGRIGEIYDYIIESKDALVGAKEEIQSLKDRLRIVEEQDDFRKGLRFERTRYHRNTEAGEEVYCSACLDVDGKRVRLGRSNENTNYKCEIHGYRL